MIKNLLVAYNGQRGSEVAFRLALGLAQAAQGRLHLAYVEPLATRVEISVSPEVDAFRPLSDLEPDLLDDPESTPSIFADVGERCREDGTACTFSHLYGDAAARLAGLARLAQIVALGRHDDMPSAGEAPLGRVARQIVTRMPAPLLLAAREHREVAAVTVVYEPTTAGGRALALAAEIAHLQNLTLNLVALGNEDMEPAVAASEARRALRAYHVEGDVLPVLTAGPEALQTAAFTWGDPLLVLPAPPRKWLSRPLDSIRPALMLPSTHLLLVP